MRSPLRSPRGRRGSVLITALLFALAMTGVLGGYFYIALQSMKLSERSYYLNAAVNLAEAGLERAMYFLNSGDGTDWANPTTNTPTLAATSQHLSGERGVVGTYRVWITNRNTNNPVIVAEGRITPPRGSPVVKQLQARLGRTSRYATGIVAKKGINLNGKNVTVDSFSSSSTFAATGSYLFATSQKRYNGSVASAWVRDDGTTIDIGTASIHGYVAVNDLANLQATKGEIRGAGAIVNPHPQNPNVDLDRVTTDFAANITDTIIDPTGSPLGGTTTLTGGAYRVASNLSKSLVIDGEVTLYVEGQLKLTGGEKITVKPGASLKLYVYGDVDVAGNAFINATNRPANLMIIGAKKTAHANDTTLRNFDVKGNGGIIGVIDVPNYSVSLGGGGADVIDTSGALIANDVKLNGKWNFHYDEDLGQDDDTGAYRVISWSELKIADFRS